MAPYPREVRESIDLESEESRRDYVKVGSRSEKRLTIVPYNPFWPAHFALLKAKIEEAVGPAALSVDHIGSTSIPGLAAKDVIDIDLTVADPRDEAAYVPQLERAGFTFMHRWPTWHEHRFFGFADPYANLHVWPPGAPGAVRHQVFRRWMLDPAHGADREAYVAAKRAASEECLRDGKTVMQYNVMKESVILEIMDRAFRAAEEEDENQPAEGRV